MELFANTKSEIVVPIHDDGKVVAEMESDFLNAHSTADREFLEALASEISKLCVS